MKQLLKLTLLLLLLPMSLMAQDKSSIEKMGTMAQKLYQKGDYKKCVDVLQKQQDLVVKLLTEKDTAYFKNLRTQARCYYRMSDFGNAQKVAKEALDNWQQNFDTSDREYILMLDNYAMYLGCGEKPDFENAIKYGKDALQRYEKLQENDNDLAIILFHLAENSFGAENFADALKYELRAIHYFKELYGEHSDEYIGELEYLAQYYEGNGQKEKAQETRDLQKKLSEEKSNGIADLPSMMEFKTPEECRAHKDDALKMIDYYLHHLITSKQISDATGYILNWSAVTDMADVVLGEEETALFTEKYLPYGVAYIAACCEYAILSDSAQFCKDMYRHAIGRMLNFYNGGNKDVTGKVPYLEKFNKEAEKKGDDALVKLVDKCFEKAKKIEKKIDASKGE